MPWTESEDYMCILHHCQHAYAMRLQKLHLSILFKLTMSLEIRLSMTHVSRAQLNSVYFHGSIYFVVKKIAKIIGTVIFTSLQ